MSTSRRSCLTLIALVAALIGVAATFAPHPSRAAAAPGGEPNCATGFDGPHCLGLGRRATISGPGSERKMTDYWLVTVAHSRDPDPADAALIESLDGQWINGMCVQDNSFHPGGVITELMTLSERYPTSPNLAHEETLAVARFFLDPYASTGTNDQVVTFGDDSLSLRDWYSGMWTYGHWVAQDRRAGVGGPTIGDFNQAPASAGARAGAAAIHRLGDRYALPWTSTTTIARDGDGTGSITTTITSASGHPVPGVAARWDPSAERGVTLSGAAAAQTDARGRATWSFNDDGTRSSISAGSTSVVPRGTVTVFVGSGQDIAGWTERDTTTIESSATIELTGTFRVEKSLSDESWEAGRDMSGFEFRVTEQATGADLGTYSTEADGRTAPITASRGTHTIDEVGQPTWAEPLDGPGPVTFEFDPSDGDRVVIDYVNTVPDASVESDARDSLDGDQVLPWFGGTAVVTLTYDVPVVGDTYVGRIVGVDRSSGQPIDGLVGEATFTAADPTGTVDIEVAVPPGPTSIVFFDDLRRADGTVIATHAGLDDERQTLTIAPPPVAEIHLRTTVSNDGATWFNAQDGVANHHHPAAAPTDPGLGSHDDQAPDEGDGLPIYSPGDAVTFRYEVWLDDASTGAVVWPGADLDALVVDDAGTPDEPDDDHHPRYASGDDGDHLLEPGETWVFDAVESMTAVAGQRYINDAVIEAGTVVAVDAGDESTLGPPTRAPSTMASPTTSQRNDPAGFTVPAIETSFEFVDHDPLAPWPAGRVDAHDRVLAINLAPDQEYRAELTVMVRRAGGECEPTDIASDATVTSDEHGVLALDVGPVRLDADLGGTFVAFQRVIDVRSGVTVATHADCEAAAQTLRSIESEPEVAPSTTTPPTSTPPPTVVPEPTPAPTPPTPDPPRRSLPTTGSGGSLGAMLVLGAALLITLGLEFLGTSERRTALLRRNE